MTAPMNASAKPAWERFGDAMVGWCGYVLLVPPTVIARPRRHRSDPAWLATTLAIAAAAAAWIYVMFTRLPPPRQAHRLRMGVFFVGVLVLASILMLRSAAVLHLHDQRLLLRLDPAAAAARLRRRLRDVVPREHAHRRVPAERRGVDVLRRDHRDPDARHRRRARSSARRSPSRTRSAARRWPSSRSRSWRTPGSTPSC